MINVKYVGRLGNNMFQYSLGRILAESMGLRLNSQPIPEFFRTFEPVNPERIEQYEPIVFNDHVLKINDEPVSVEDIVNLKDKAVYLDGWFQRYEYYRPYKEKIREWLHIEDIDVGQTENDAIIHLRMGDCIIGDLAKDPYVMPHEYFNKALEIMDFENLFICSDPETLNHPLFKKYMENFSEYCPTLLCGDKIEDFRAIKSFDKIVMSQSTFSWWGAFLSSASQIFVPVPEPGPHTNEWSLESKNVAVFVDDEERYSYLKQYGHEWKLVNLKDIPET